MGTRSHLSLPLNAGGPMLGVLSFDCVQGERVWPAELVQRLQLLGEVFASSARLLRRATSAASTEHVP